MLILMRNILLHSDVDVIDVILTQAGTEGVILLTLQFSSGIRLF